MRAAVAIIVAASAGGLVGGMVHVSISAAPAGWVEGQAAAPTPEDERSGQAEVATVVRGLLDRDPVLSAQQPDLLSLYGVAAGGRLEPLWVDNAGRPGAQARAGMAVLGAAAEDGLNPADYEVSTLSTLAGALEGSHEGPGRAVLRAETAARFEITLSAALLRYLRDVHLGRVDPRRIGFQLNIPNDRHDFPALLRTAVGERRVSALFEAYRPPLEEYARLRDALARYRAMPMEAWQEIPRPLTRSVRPGDRFEGAPLVRRRLIAIGDLSAAAPLPSDPREYDGSLAAAVSRFQTRHGLAPDGVLGKATLAALDVPHAWRVRQLEFALERQRWLPHVGRERLVIVNIPMFRLWAWDTIPPRGPAALSTGVIVGRAVGTETPVFASQIREVVFQPYWNVPTSILRKETLPAIERDSQYLEKENMEIVRGQGDNATPVALGPDSLAELRRGTLRVRQRPGPRNALGSIKFVFPNENDVYMHATPARTLFARHRRDFSHGCVRVEDPVGLAEWLFAGQSDWDRARIVSSMDTPPISQYVALARPAQVVLFYTTAGVSPEDGSIWFAEDIYGHDPRLDRALGRSAGDQP